MAKWIGGILAAILIGVGGYLAQDIIKNWWEKPDPVVTEFAFDRAASNWSTLQVIGQFKIFNNSNKIARRCYLSWTGDAFDPASSPALDLPGRNEKMIPLTVHLKQRGKSKSQAALLCAEGIAPPPYDLALDVDTDAQGNAGKVETIFGNKIKSYTINQSVIRGAIVEQPFTTAPNN